MLSNEELNEQLFDAVKNENVEEVELLIEKGADVNAQDRCGCTPLYWVYGNVEIMRLLLEEREAARKHVSTPLCAAIEDGNIEVVRLLIEKGADVNAQGECGNTPLHLAAKNGHTDVAQFLIGNGADVSAQDEYGNTPLHLAAKNGHTDVARFLIGNGADVDAQSVYGIPLYLAVERGNIEVFFLLLLYGADISAEDRWKINRKPLTSCLAEFEQIKATPHLGGLIEAYKSGDKKAISQYIDNAKNQEALVAKYKGIKERCTNEQLSFVPEYLCDFVKHITLKFLKSHIDEKTMASYLSESKDDIKIIKLQNNKTRAVYELLPKIASEKIVSYSDNDTKENVLLALSKKADVFLNELKNIYQSPNAPLAQPQLEEIDPSAKLQCNL
ncbi:ankyrin repeat domain-containing protein [Candidatus Mesenet endosymbiont of Agriotes lineatus]|uniref:ankyrin repeat domain-containing protein n=1 Tax=Candidatus Mesenet endosymbiont of Agriotes lineatus TaxID=3077948 RepID=UPI0030D3ACFE